MENLCISDISDIDINIHEGVNLNQVILPNGNIILDNQVDTSSIMTTDYYKTFLSEKPELTPFVVECQFLEEEGEIEYLNILYRYNGEIWNRIYKYGSIILQNRY